MPAPILNRKAKGDLAELVIAADLRRRGYKIAFPYGEDWDFDLILCRSGKLERVQAKYVESDGVVVEAKCYSESLTNGKVRAAKRYTAAAVDWIAVYDKTSDACYYLPAAELGSGRTRLSLRLVPPRNGQLKGIRSASEYRSI